MLIWLLTLAFIALAFLCVIKDYTGTLPWPAITLTGAWTAYGVSQAMYYKKSEKENTRSGIATRSDTPTPYRVLSRLDDNHIRVLIR